MTTVAGLASAGEVHLTGSTLGKFNAQAFASTTSLLGLTYNNSTFDNSTVGGSLDLGGNPNPAADFNNLGSFLLSNANATYNGNMFTVQVTFTSPTTINGGSVTTFTDVLSGTVTGGLGGVFVDFDNTPKTFTYSNAAAMGSFTMFVNDVSIAPGQAASITGHITGSEQPVPEPTVMAGLACGALGLLRRRKQA